MGVAIGLGGNLGGPAAILERFQRAREALAELGRVRSSALYRSSPIGPPQPDYLNAAVDVAIDPATEPRALIATILELEALGGRDRRGEEHWGPRALDLDVLAWDDRTIAIDALIVPHPRLTERRFVVAPLVDLYGGVRRLPGSAATLAALLAGLGAQPCERVAGVW